MDLGVRPWVQAVAERPVPAVLGAALDGRLRMGPGFDLDGRVIRNAGRFARWISLVWRCSHERIQTEGRGRDAVLFGRGGRAGFDAGVEPRVIFRFRRPRKA